MKRYRLIVLAYALKHLSQTLFSRVPHKRRRLRAFVGFLHGPGPVRRW